jgi:hypothetical protein
METTAAPVLALTQSLLLLRWRSCRQTPSDMLRVAIALSLIGVCLAAAPLPSFNANLNETTFSGLSSGTAPSRCPLLLPH